MDNYTVSLEDVKTYLSTLAPDEVCGETNSYSTCLVACALNHKYQDTGTKFGVLYECAFPLPRGVHSEIEITQQVEHVARLFDCMHEDMRPVSRKDVEKWLPDLDPEEDYSAPIQHTS